MDAQRVEYSQNLGKLQYSILRRAFCMTKPGGLVVYATCTYAPEENECIVSHLLHSYSRSAYLETPSMPPSFDYSTGLTSWNGEELGNELEKTVRVWPHQNDTGGFYIAMIRKRVSY